MTKEEYIFNVTKLNKYSYAYYCEDKPMVTDEEYDKLYQDVLKYEQDHLNDILSNSPTQRVGDKIKDGFIKHTRQHKMYSLDNVFNLEELKKWLINLNKKIPEEQQGWCCSPKFDGCSIELDYTNNNTNEPLVLAIASTRGDGITGENVTANAKTIHSIPLSLNNTKDVTIRGEIVISKTNFKKLNKLNNNKFSNPRNLASGSLRQLDPNITKSRKLEFIPWGIVNVDKTKSSSFYEQMKDTVYTNNHFINGIQYFQHCKTIDEVLEYADVLTKTRDKYPYELDGCVITVDNLNVQESLGYTQKCPRFSIALKFPPKEVMTRIIDVENRVADTGTITPVAILEPVKIGGRLISKVTLHNYEKIKTDDIRIGDHIAIILSGDVIPKIVNVFKNSRNGEEIEIVPPTVCPKCGSNKIELHGKFLKCLNEGDVNE